jgi:hypothetical protein
LTTVSTHVLKPSQQGLVQPFVVKHRLQVGIFKLDL